jgi:hypothetical protein
VTTEDVARRYSSRPGYTLVSYGEVGLPYYRIQLRVEVLDRKQIGPFAEFLLRSVDLGIDEPDELEELLGLDQRVLEASVVDLLGSDDLHVGRREEGGQTGLLITPKGRRTLETAVSIVPEEVIIEIDYDGLLQRPIPFLDRWYTPIELKEMGVREVPPARVRPPELPKLQQQMEAVEAVIRAVGERRAARRDLLALKAIERRRRVFQTAVALVYRSDDDSSIQVAFAIDGRLSDEHEQVFAQSKLMRKMGIGADGLQNAEDVLVELLGTDLVEAARQAEAPHPAAALVPEPIDTPAAPEVPEADAEMPSPPTSRDLLEAPEPVVLPDVAFVETYDHPGYLRQALDESRNRLLIVSPWVREAVVGRAFLDQLEGLLANGIDVYIGWGIRPLDEDDDDADRGVQRAFQKLGERYRWNFKYKRLGHTHAKVLICDSRFMIVTSFNWLSFKGDPSRTFRDERGILVSRADEIDRQFDEWVRRFDGARTTP